MFKFLVLFPLCLWRPLAVASPDLLRVFVQRVRAAAVRAGGAFAAPSPVLRHPARPPVDEVDLADLQPFFTLTHAPTLRC